MIKAIKLGSLTMLLASQLFLSGCFTYSNMTTGRSLGKGTHEMSGYVSSYYVQDAGISAPVLPQLSYTYGITDRFDLGGQLGIYGTFGLHAKHQLIGNQNSPFCFAPGISFDYFALGSRGSSDPNSTDDINFNFSNVSFIGHTSYHITDRFAFYMSPKLVLLSYNDSANPATTLKLLGLTPGIEAGGERIKFGVEGNLLFPQNKNDRFTGAFGTISLGMKWRF